jgi:hypothetical protein
MLTFVGSRIRLMIGLAGFALVVGIAAVAGVRVAATPDLMTVAWWNDGLLHVGSHTVDTARPDNLEMVRDGVVLWAPTTPRDGPSGVVWVDDSGHRRTIGSKSWSSPVAADSNGTTAAWVEATRTTQPQLIIYDTAELAVIARRPLMKRGPRWGALDEGSFPISIDGDRVYYAAQDGDYSWDFRSDNPPRRLDAPAYLQAREAGVSITTRPYPEPDEIAANGSTAVLPDGPWQISPDGRLAGTISIDGDLALWDVVAQRRLAPGPLANRPIVDLSFDGEGRIVVARGTAIDPSEHCFGVGACLPASGPPFDIAVCSVKPVSCTTVASSKARIWPVLAR